MTQFLSLFNLLPDCGRHTPSAVPNRQNRAILHDCQLHWPPNCQRSPHRLRSKSVANTQLTPNPPMTRHILTLAYLLIAFVPLAVAQTDPRADALSPEVWRRERRIIDLHMHIEGKPERYERAIRIMDPAGIGVGIELGSGTVTHKPGEVSEFEKAVKLSNEEYPGRFLHYMLLDYTDWDSPDWSERAAKQIEEGQRLGAAGLKEFKRLGLVLRDGSGKLIKIDDPKLDAVWAKCGKLGMPVSIHVADPKAFWEPYNEANERWEELRDHPSWWFGDPAKHPPRMELVEALSRVIARHPKTTFVCVHFANNSEDLDWVDQALGSHPNMMADIAARVPEFGRHDPARVRSLFEKYPDRFIFGTDFQVHDRLILGSAGDAERPTDTEGYVFFQKHWRFFETTDRDWAHMTPIQGPWTISSINLPPAVLRKVYFDNARKLLAKSFPLPVMTAPRLTRDFVPDGKLAEVEWGNATPARIEYDSLTVTAHPELSTAVRALWSHNYLYLGYECPYTEISNADPAARPKKGESDRLGLWEFDVVEAFIAPDPKNVTHYSEYEWAPSGEELDLTLIPGHKDFDWSSHMESAVTIDEKQKIWRVEVRIPLASISDTKLQPGTRWRINLYRHDRANKAYLAWNPTLTQTFHTPERFGWLEFEEAH